MRALVGLAVLTVLVSACGADRSPEAESSSGTATPGATATPTATVTSSATVTPTPTPAPAAAVPPDAGQAKKLRRELLGMARRDQRERTGGALGEGDQARTQRLREIIATYGWPMVRDVGDDGGDAAWLIAQHSDLDLAFQQEALALITAAAAEGQASPGNVAYLYDRVAVAEERPQRYGTQISCDGPTVELRTPLEDAEAVDRLRRQAGLETLAAYFRELKDLCRAPE